MRVSQILSSSKGRDKICGIIQYFFKTISFSTKHSNIQKIRNQFKAGKFRFCQLSDQIYQKISGARKIFRFLKFLDVFSVGLVALKSANFVAFEQKGKQLFLLAGHVQPRLRLFLFYFRQPRLPGPGGLVQVDLTSKVLLKTEQKHLSRIKNYLSLFRVILSIIISLIHIKTAHK